MKKGMCIVGVVLLGLGSMVGCQFEEETALQVSGGEVGETTECQLLEAVEGIEEAARVYLQGGEPIELESYGAARVLEVESVAIRAQIEGEQTSWYEVEGVTKRACVRDGREDLVRLREFCWVRVSEGVGEVLSVTTDKQNQYERMAFDEAIPDHIQEAIRRLVQMQLEQDATEEYLVDEMQIQIKPSIYSTQKQPCFTVSVPVTLLLNHYNKVYYRYNYFVRTQEEGEWEVKCISKTPLDP
ncbi:MAG: hypothetical protein ACRCTE_06940 [Cellulosilyticaceae bacterium]